MNFQDFLDVLEIKEEYEIQSKLMEIMLSENKDCFLDKLIDIGFDIKKDEIRNIFENELANRKTLKQDYTPDCLCELVSKLCGNQNQLLDVCCGVGSLTIKNITSGNTHFFMEEISNVSISLLLLNMSIRNCNATIYRKNVLTQEIFETYELKAQERYSSITKVTNDSTLIKQDCIISNPPYSLSWEPLNDERFWNYDLAPKSKADYAFVLDILYRLNDNGRAFVILPHGVLFRGGTEEKIRKALIHDNVIDCVIGLPDKLFLNTGIPIIILGLKRNRNNKDILFIDASKEFEKQGKQNVVLDKHISKLLETYNNRKEIDKYSKNVSFEEIERNDFNLNIPRYIDSFEKPEPIDIGKTIEEIVDLENQIHDIDLELVKMFKEPQGPQEYELEKAKIIEHLTNRYVHDISNAMNKTFTFMNTEKQLANHKEKELLDLVNIERSKKNKVYPKGSILIQLSATRGQMGYLENESTVDSKYGVMTIKDDNVNSKYLYYMLSIEMESFLRVYQTGLNIVPDVFKYMKLKVHNDRTIQDKIQKMFDEVEKIEKAYQEDIENWKNIKQYYLDNMFI